MEKEVTYTKVKYSGDGIQIVEEVKERKVPGGVFSTFLIIFLYILLRTVYEKSSEIYSSMFDDAVADGEPIAVTFLMAGIEIILLYLSLWSFVRLLKIFDDAICCIKWALWTNFVVILFQFTYSLVLAYYTEWYYAYIPAFKLIFTIVFLIYLSQSKEVEKLFPKHERKFAPGGWIWVAYAMICLVFVGYVMRLNHLRNVKNQAIDMTLLNIPSGHYSDGLIAFRSDSAWVDTTVYKRDANLDEMPVNMHFLKSDSITYKILDGISEKTRHVDFMSLLLQNRPQKDSLFVSEVSFCDTMIENEQYYVAQYRYTVDSVDYLWTFSARYDSNSNKYCAYSKYSDNMTADIERIGSLSFLKGVSFDLNHYLRKHDSNN